MIIGSLVTRLLLLSLDFYLRFRHHLIAGTALELGPRGDLAGGLISRMLGLKVHLDVMNWFWLMHPEARNDTHFMSGRREGHISPEMLRLASR
jgi:hypothetical protein